MELTQIPKIELHLHLDGAVPPETMWRMAQEKGLALPADTLEDFRTWLVRTADCRDVNTYLAALSCRCSSCRMRRPSSASPLTC